MNRGSARPMLGEVSEVSPGEDDTLRWTHLHLIEGYPRHYDHADLLRGCLNGLTGE